MRLPPSLLPLLTASCLSALTASPAQAQQKPAQQTIMEGDNLVIESKPDGRTVFVFSNNVRIIGTNLLSTCDRLEIVSLGGSENKSAPAPTPKPAANGQLPLLPAATSPVGAIELITATGHVEIFQGTRHATSDKAEIYPNEKVKDSAAKKDSVGRIVLSGSPKVVDGTSQLTGGRITLYTGEGRIVVEPEKSDFENTRPTVILETPAGK